MKVQFDVLLNLDDADASDVGESGKAAEPGEDLPADSGGHHMEYAVQRKDAKVSDNGSASVRRSLWCRLSYALSGLK
jgi:hypothetical protein